MRTLLERLAGRKKVIDTSIKNLSEAVEIIRALPTDTNISFSYGSNFTESYRTKSKEKVVQYLERTFEDYKNCVNIINYQVFEGRGKTKSVLSFSLHLIEPSLSVRKYSKASLRNARVTFATPLSTNGGQR